MAGYNKEKNFVSAVVHVHNDGDYIGKFLNDLYGVLEENFLHFEIICVNNASRDNSSEVIRAFAAAKENAAFSLIHMSIYQGMELAMNAGRDMAIGDFVFEFDQVPMDYTPAMVMEVYRRSLTGYDIVAASPRQNRRLSSKIFYRLFNTWSKSPYPLRSESFRVLSRRAINRVHGASAAVPYRKAVYAGSGLKMDAITYDPLQTVDSPSQEGRRPDLAMDSLVLFTDLTYRLSVAMTCLMMLLTLCAGVYTVAIYWGQDKPVAGWTTTMLLLSAAFFGVFLILAVVVKYLSIILDLLFKKQKYLVESVEKLAK